MLSAKLLLKQPAVEMFLEAIGIDADPFHDLEKFHLACEQANPRYKGGRDLVRFQLETDETKWPKGVQSATLNLAEKLGMMYGEKQLEGVIDICCIPGGAREAPLLRALYAVEAIVRGRASASILAIAGSIRPLQDAEKAVANYYAEGAETEFDLCTGAANFVKAKHPEINVQTVCNHDATSGNDGVIRRVMEELGDIKEGANLVFAAVTTKIYFTGLLLDLNRLKQTYNWEYCVAAGHPSDPKTVSARSLAVYLAECLTTLDKAAKAAQYGC